MVFFAVTVGLWPAAGSAADGYDPALVLATIDGVLGWAQNAGGGDGFVADVVGRWSGSYPAGAMFALVVEADRGEQAVIAARELARMIVSQSGGLTGWVTGETELFACDPAVYTLQRR